LYKTGLFSLGLANDTTCISVFRKIGVEVDDMVATESGKNDKLDWQRIFIHKELVSKLSQYKIDNRDG
jgi:hypothetical protein